MSCSAVKWGSAPRDVASGPKKEASIVYTAGMSNSRHMATRAVDVFDFCTTNLGFLSLAVLPGGLVGEGRTDLAHDVRE